MILLDFDAGDAPLNRNDDFLYTIFVPGPRARGVPLLRSAGPESALDARRSTCPTGWETIANGAETARARERAARGSPSRRRSRSPRISSRSRPARFIVEQAERNGRTFRMLHRETDAQKVARNRDAIFDLHAAALDWLERYTGIPYPFGKFDFVLVPAFQFGGMEHPGAVFYNAARAAARRVGDAESDARTARASIAHETSHMWFGDLVTMTWFTDVWMKEVFANFMAAKIVNPSFPDVNHDLRFLHAYYPLAYDVDRTAGTNAIRQPLDNLKDAGTLYGAIIYQKAPIVMRQLETLMGADAFRDGLREYLRAHKFGNASWPDLDRAARRAHAGGPRDVEPRLGRRGGTAAIVTTELAVADGRIAHLAFTTRDPYPRRGLTWTEDLQVALGYADRVQLVSVTPRAASEPTSRGAAVFRRRCSSCPTAAASATANSPRRAEPRVAVATPAGDRATR